MSYTNICHSFCCLQGESRQSTESTGLILLQWLSRKGWFSWESFTLLGFGCGFWAPAWLGMGKGAARLYRAQIKCTCFSRVRWDLNKSWLFGFAIFRSISKHSQFQSEVVGFQFFFQDLHSPVFCQACLYPHRRAAAKYCQWCIMRVLSAQNLIEALDRASCSHRFPVLHLQESTCWEQCTHLCKEKDPLMCY